MSAELKILVGTMTGTAEMVAEEVRDVFEDRGVPCEIVLMDGLASDALQPGPVYLICTSTYGQGDVPDNAQQLYESLKDDAPDLSAVSYGLIALGDMTYQQTFCEGGKRFEEVMQKCKAKRIGDAFFHDAAAGTLPEEEAISWAESWAELVETAKAAA